MKSAACLAFPESTSSPRHSMKSEKTPESGCHHCHCDHHESPADATPEPPLVAGPAITLQVQGVDCPEEVALIKRALKPIAGVGDVRVNVLTGQTVVFHDGKVDPAKLVQAIGKAGLKATVGTQKQKSEASLRAGRLRAVVSSAVFTGGGLLLEWSHRGPAWLAIFCFVAGILSGGFFVAPKAWRSLTRFQLDMNVLMAIAVLGAAFIGQWSEAAVVVLLFSVSELLESFSIARARRAIETLVDLSPPTARVRKGESFEEAPVESVELSAEVEVRPGARVPLDGQVLEGRTSINQAPITGESLPVEKEPGNEVYAGTINGEGRIVMRVTKRSSDTMLARIIHLVEEAQEQRAPSQRFVDVFAKYYTPSVMMLAVIVALLPPLAGGQPWAVWFYRALVLLVIACPCALVISTPVSIVSGLTAMARRGVLIKGGAFLESIGRLKALAVDKTGTITRGTTRITAIVPLGGATEAEVIRISAAIDAHSDHPLAKAVVDYARENHIAIPQSVQPASVNGRGAEASLEDHRYFVGNHRFTHELGVCSGEIENRLEQIEARGQSVIVVGHRPHDACAGEVIGILAVGDEIRPDATAAVKALHDAGVERVVMLSGDNQRTAEAVAAQVGIDEVHGDLLPDDKIAHIRRLIAEKRHVGMIGDGVNDAPAMAAASIGIAMGAAGTDTAIETADIALMKDDLSKVAEAIVLGRRTLRVIQFNIAFAILIKVVFLSLAVVGRAGLWLAILADTGATLIVIMNSLRLLSAKDKP